MWGEVLTIVKFNYNLEHDERLSEFKKNKSSYNVP